MISDFAIFVLREEKISANAELKDYKFMCFNGQVKYIYTSTEQFSGDEIKALFDSDDTSYPFGWHNLQGEKLIPKPNNFEIMIELAKKLSKDIPVVRVDFYEFGRQIYFGEMVIYPGSGIEMFALKELDKTHGDWIELPISAGGGYTVIDGITVFIKIAYKPSETDLRDYKFYCFNGKPQYCQVISNRSKSETIDFYDMDWVHQKFTGLSLPHRPYPYSERMIARPVTFEHMKSAAKILSDKIPFLRVDFYEVNGKMYFGELTFYPASGFGVFEPEEWNKILGNLIKLCNE